MFASVLKIGKLLGTAMLFVVLLLGGCSPGSTLRIGGLSVFKRGMPILPQLLTNFLGSVAR